MRNRFAAILAIAVTACTDPAVTPDAAAGDGARDAGGACTPTVDFVAALADPYAPARRLPGHVTLVSSRSPEPQPGMHNDDFGHFIAPDGDRVLLVDETGPGVITRLWLTYGPPMVGTISDVPLRLTIDGRDVIVDAPLGEVAGPASTIFPAPWSLDPSTSSGGLSISVPIQFQERARVEVIVAPGSWAYYQADVRHLPADACVRSFTGALSSEDRAALTDAATIWRDHVHGGTDTTMAPTDVAPGAFVEATATGPGVITVLEVAAPVAARSSLAVRITVDGSVAADAPLAWLTGSAPPAGTYASALTASTETAATLYAPIPVERTATIRVTNDGAASASVGLRLRAVSLASIDADVGRFRAECGSAHAAIPVHAVQPPFDDTFPNIVLAHSTAGPAQFAGITTFQTTPGDPWYWALEPDHEVSLDGSYDILGTGTEDYFGGAFYFEGGPYTSVTSGASGWDRPTGTTPPFPDAHTHLYRHHLVDGWPFEHEMTFEMESYVDGTQYDGCIFLYTF